MRKKEGLVQVYTGNGKGKTTAALGLALRASGAGFNVYIMQFIKKGFYSELKALKKIKNIKIEQCGKGCFVKTKPKKNDIELACKGLKKANDAIMSGKYQLVILDEINIALKVGLIRTKDITRLINSKPRFLELILTGRYASRTLLKKAHLVTEMKERKHPYQKGIKSRRGIEF